jgi:hypothetical protein
MWFVTFCDSKYARTRERIRREAVASGYFEEVRALGEGDLGEGFWSRHADFVRGNPPGFGYWLWKPYVILKTLQEMREGDVLVYADGGCTINPGCRARLEEYAETAKSNRGIFFPGNTSGKSNLGQWTKGDLLAAFPDVDPSWPMVHAGVNVICNTEYARRFVEKWYELAASDGYRYIDDSPSRLPNRPDFRENRHDQAVVTVLLHREGLFVDKGPQILFADGFKRNMDRPIHARRLKY